MKLKNLIIAASVALLPLSISAATLVIPVAGSTSGANGSVWKSEITFHNSSTHDLGLTLTYHDGNGAGTSATLTVPARGTISRDDAVATLFSRTNSVGAIAIDVNDADANRVAVTSRIFNAIGNAEFGQDVPAIRSTDAVSAGEVAVISGPRTSSDFRFNAGLYTLAATTVRWELVRADGAVASTQTVSYAAGVQNQYSVPALLGTLADNDVVQANALGGAAIFYGSIINNASGDPSFVPGIRNRSTSLITLLGVDRDENGTIDIPAHDNVLDRPVDAYTRGYPSFFRVVTSEPVTYEIVSSTADARIIDQNGSMELAASVALQGTTGTLVLRATNADGVSTVLTIPVKFF
ncbi:MAG: hypothetical protein NVSMB68_14060 [Thermoanaerobaculia bacterium]